MRVLLLRRSCLRRSCPFASRSPPTRSLPYAPQLPRSSARSSLRCTSRRAHAARVAPRAVRTRCRTGRAGRAGRAEPDGQSRTGRAGRAEPDGRAGRAEPDEQSRTGRAGRAEPDGQSAVWASCPHPAPAPAPPVLALRSQGAAPAHPPAAVRRAVAARARRAGFRRPDAPFRQLSSAACHVRLVPPKVRRPHRQQPRHARCRPHAHPPGPPLPCRLTPAMASHSFPPPRATLPHLPGFSLCSSRRSFSSRANCHGGCS